MFDSFSAHKVKGNEGGKGGKKEKQKEDSSPVRNWEVPGLGLGEDHIISYFGEERR
jgi:hypothetical protein